MKRVLSLVVLCAGCMGVCAGQGALPLGTFNTSATVYAQPTHVDFFVYWDMTKESLEAGAAAAKVFEDAFRKEVDKDGLRPVEIEATAPRFSLSNRVDMRLRLVYELKPYTADDAGRVAFAKLMDTLKGIAALQQARLEGPRFYAADPNPLRDAAMSEAVQQAYAMAQAAAVSMNGALANLDSLEVVSVQWNVPEISEAAVPNLKEISCQVSIKAVYTLSVPEPAAAVKPEK